MIVGLYQTAQQLRHRPANTPILELSSTLFLVALCVTAFAAPHFPLRHWINTLSYAWLALTVWVTLAVGQPFTLDIAAQFLGRCPRERLFVHTHVRISLVCTTAFSLVAAALAGCLLARLGEGSEIAFQMAGLGMAALFTLHCIKTARARHATTATGAG